MQRKGRSENCGAGRWQRHDHYLESWWVTSIHNVLLSLNKMTEWAINIIEFLTGDFQIKSSFEGHFRMAAVFKGLWLKDSLQTFQLSPYIPLQECNSNTRTHLSRDLMGSLLFRKTKKQKMIRMH